MLQIETLNEWIRYFKIPYKDIFVGIYVILHPGGAILFDTAATAEDVDGYIAPALAQLGVTGEKLTHIFISHNHKDHAGGLARAAVLYPNARIVSRCPELKAQYPGVLAPEDGDLLTKDLQVVTIPGHTRDSAALLDLRTNTMVTGDCLQGYGIYGSGEWYGAVSLPAEHFAAIEKLRKLPVETVAAAHDYHPCGMVSRGSGAVTARLDSCVEALDRVRGIMEANPQMNDEQIAQLCNDGSLPKIAAKIVTALRKMAAGGTIL